MNIRKFSFNFKKKEQEQNFLILKVTWNVLSSYVYMFESLTQFVTSHVYYRVSSLKIFGIVI
jgi:hypothetical protein